MVTTMQFQTYIVQATRQAADEFFRYANALSTENLEFKVGEGARSAIEICREVALCPGWAVDILNDGATEWNEEAIAKMEEEAKALGDLEACKREFDQRFAKFSEKCASIPDSMLSDTRWLPFEGGRDFTFVEMMEYPRWNLNYHTGQIAQIQLALGDKEMH